MGGADFEHRYTLQRLRMALQQVHQVAVDHPGGDDPQRDAAGRFGQGNVVAVEPFLPFEAFADRFQLIVQLLVQEEPRARGGRPAVGVFPKTCPDLVRLQGRRQVQGLPGMADPRGGPDDHRQPLPLGEPVGRGHHRPRFGRRGRVQDRQQGKKPEEPRVLLGLGRVGPRVVGGDDQETAFHPLVGRTQGRVGGNIEPHLLHHHRRALARHGSGQGHFEGHFFVDRPLEVRAEHVALHKSAEGGEDL